MRPHMINPSRVSFVQLECFKADVANCSGVFISYVDKLEAGNNDAHGELQKCATVAYILADLIFYNVLVLVFAI